eukprot:TRINITY_DN15758_c0_g1_i1.p1 TRINITY_DN15758_c0_g1~~TRINITY_DN15758_c0_g1_i1.p1  ORF type:complete len:475 (+),score=100.24 TRINITY_DN15758_c0_g1_i1:184-1608(+)
MAPTVSSQCGLSRLTSSATSSSATCSEAPVITLGRRRSLAEVAAQTEVPVAKEDIPQEVLWRRLAYTELVKVCGSAALPELEQMREAFEKPAAHLNGVEMFRPDMVARVQHVARSEDVATKVPKALKTWWSSKSFEDQARFCGLRVLEGGEVAPDVAARRPGCSHGSRRQAVLKSDKPAVQQPIRLAVLLLERWLRVLKPHVPADDLPELFVRFVHGDGDADGLLDDDDEEPLLIPPDPAVYEALLRQVPRPGSDLAVFRATLVDFAKTQAMEDELPRSVVVPPQPQQWPSNGSRPVSAGSGAPAASRPSSASSASHAGGFTFGRALKESEEQPLKSRSGRRLRSRASALRGCRATASCLELWSAGQAAHSAEERQRRRAKLVAETVDGIPLPSALPQRSLPQRNRSESWSSLSSATPVRLSSKPLKGMSELNRCWHLFDPHSIADDYSEEPRVPSACRMKHPLVHCRLPESAT